MSGIYRNRATWANSKAADTLTEYARLRLKPPDVVIRSDQHRYASSGDNYPVTVYQTPCWQLHTEYIYKINGENSLPDIGGLIFIIDDNGGYTCQKVFYPISSSGWQPVALPNTIGKA
jgi:hypothetical protein